MKELWRISACLAVVAALTAVGIWIGSSALTVMSESQPMENRICVILDPGHGGEDGGATSCTGILESGINLEIALRLEDMLHLLGRKTIMIRREDTSIYTKGETIAQKKISDLKDRVRIVNEQGNAVLVSIHQNYFPMTQYSGPQVFYADNTESRLLASALQKTLISSLAPDCKRKEKSGKGIYLLEKINTCGVLIECGFLSNPSEENRLRQSSYQKKISAAIGAALSTYLS